MNTAIPLIVVGTLLVAVLCIVGKKSCSSQKPLLKEGYRQYALCDVPPQDIEANVPQDTMRYLEIYERQDNYHNNPNIYPVCSTPITEMYRKRRGC